MTLWYDYKLRGQGDLICALDACNSVVKGAPLVQPKAVAQSAPLTQGQIYSGTYHLKSIDYQWDATCDTLAPVSAAETLVVNASGTITGSMSLVHDEPNQPAVHSTFNYKDGGANTISIDNVCGGVVLAGDHSGFGYSASATELRLHETLNCKQGGFVDYDYEEQ
jgi:hypothetical protein